MLDPTNQQETLTPENGTEAVTETGSGIEPEIRTEKGTEAGTEIETPLILTSEDEARARKELNKAKKEAKKARKAARKAAEKAAEAEEKAERKRKQEELKVIVVDGQVVDQHGNPIRPYTRSEWFFDNKPLCYTIGAGVIVLSLIFSYFLTLESVS